MTTAFQVDHSKQHSPFGKTSPGYRTPDPASMKRADAFTPAYAHPMHQPQHMTTMKNFNPRRLELEPCKKEETTLQNEREKCSQQEENRSPSIGNIISSDQNHKLSRGAKSTQENKSNEFRKGSVSNNDFQKSDELQLQLEELDLFIAELSKTSESIAPKTSMLKRSASCANAGSNRPKRVVLPPQSSSVKVKVPDSAPNPPSRSKSSYNSVSRRLPASSSLDRGSSMKTPSVESGIQSPIRDDDVFTSQNVPQTSFPPQTRLTRPTQQQISPGAQTGAPSSPPRRPNKFEKQLSPQLFIAMSLNPGGRPVEEIHSYKEDLDPSCGSDVFDSTSPVTPGFPVPPKTPYVNDKSPVSAHFPVGSVRTPLSILGLEHKPNPEPIEEVDGERQSQQHLKNSPAQQVNRSMPNSDHLSNGFKEGTRQNNKPDQSSLSLSAQKEFRSSSAVQESSRVGLPSESKPNLLSNNSHDSGYADSHPVHLSSNGSAFSELSSTTVAQTRLSPGSQQEHFQNRAHPPTSHHRLSSGEGGGSSGASRSFSGSSDSLLSDASSSGHHYRSNQSKNTPQPALPPKESSLRKSGTGIRRPSAGNDQFGRVLQNSQSPTGQPMLEPTSNHHSSLSYSPLQRSESQMSSYERQGAHYPLQYALSSDDGHSDPTSARTSGSSTAEIDRIANDFALAGLNNSTKFVKDTTSFWYKPDITREQALAMLRRRHPGSFVVRDSRCYPGAFGLALKVQRVPESVLKSAKPGTDLNDELVRHYLIEPSSRGVKLKGCANEPVFGSLSALIYQHSITPLALPCKLVIPLQNQEVPLENGSGTAPHDITNSKAELLRQGAACNVIYIGSIETESLTGPEAVERSISECLQYGNAEIKTSVVHFKVSAQGITLTDNARKIFFRRHYPTATVTFCGMSPNTKRWNASSDRGPPDARIFGFVAKKSASSMENVCHLFAELDLDQPAEAIVNFVTKILIGSG